MANPRVRIEHLEHPLGIGNPAPRLSWQLPSDSERQVAYELALLDGSTTGRVESHNNVLVEWPFEPLRSRSSAAVRVRVWLDQESQPSEWSVPTSLEAGLLNAEDWSASWVAPPEGSPNAAPTAAKLHPTYVLRGLAAIDKPILRARLYATAHGIYEAYVNGKRVGEFELTPGFTEYRQRTQVQTYDVTELLQPGHNVLGAIIADGWFRGQVGMMRLVNQFGNQTAFLAQLQVDHPDGTTTIIGTDDTWRSTPSHITQADLIEGQVEDRRVWFRDLAPLLLNQQIGRDGDQIELLDLGYAHLVASPAPPVCRVAELRPVSVTTLGPQHQVFDLGQNINGWVRLTNLGAQGTTITLTHGEALGPDGDVTTEHLKPADIPFIEGDLTAGSVDQVTSAGIVGDVFEPRFTTHGFQYVRIEGHPGELTVEDLVGVVVHTDLRRVGNFECSNSRVNALHEAAVWSFRGNACDIPTDCPTRERAGWTGDWQLYVPTATFLYDVAGFSDKWLKDLAAAQWDNGVVPNMLPMPPDEQKGFLKNLNGSAGWGDASVLVPWEIYLEHGDARLLREQWPSMVAWLGFVAGVAAEQRHPSREAARPEPAAHEKYLWDAGFHWGEWLVPGEDLSDFGAFISRDESDTATAYFAWTAGQAARVATVLGLSDEAVRYQELSDAAADAWRQEFLGADGQIEPLTQANLVRALTFGLIPEELRQETADQLARLVRDNGTRLATGFLATPDLLPTLASHGYLDVAYDLLYQDQSPSWMAMINRGATTVWERWEGIDDDGVPHESLNHYSKGAVISFLHRQVAGLVRTEATWRRFRVMPRPGGGLTWAKAQHETPHGLAAVEWQLDDEFTLTVTVPPGCAADVILPDASEREVGPGTYTFVC